MTQDQEVYALADYGYPINGTGYNLTIDSGGFIAYAGNQTYQPNFIFGTTGPSGTDGEGVIYNMWGSTFTGNLTANNNLTIAGRTQDYGFRCYLTGNNTIMSNDGASPGTLTINGGGCVMINSASAIGGSATAVYINGGGGDLQRTIERRHSGRAGHHERFVAEQHDHYRAGGRSIVRRWLQLYRQRFDWRKRDPWAWTAGIFT